MNYLARIMMVTLLALTSLSTPSFADDYLFTLQGSNTMGAKLVPQLVKEFLLYKGYRDVTIQAGAAENEYTVSGLRKSDGALQFGQVRIAAHGSGTGFAALREGQADIAMSSRPVKPAEADALQSLANMRLAWVEHAIAIDGLAILVNPSNPVSQLTVTQVAKIFAGEIDNWKELGGHDRPITLYARDEKSGTWDTFRELVLGGSLPLDVAAQRFESSEQLSDKVANDPGSIGFAGLSFVREAKLVAIADDGAVAMKPGNFTVATEDYPLSRRLYLYSPGYLKHEAVREFIEFCQSTAGQQIVGDSGFVSQNIQQFAYGVDKDAPDEYRQLSRRAKRLSLNFRFDEGSPRLDNKAYRDLERLMDYLETNREKEQKLYLVGFSDARHNLTLDMVLSRFRALAVKSALMEENITVEEFYALGSYNPVSANHSSQSRVRNGRVEVWVSNPALTQTTAMVDDVAGR